MEGHSAVREVFRRSWLTIAPEWALAGSLSLTGVLAACRFDALNAWEHFALFVLPLIWVELRTLQWFYQTWTITKNGVITIDTGLLVHTRQELYLRSIQDLETEASPLAHWLGIGHVRFNALNSRGQFQLVRWTWVGKHLRLCEILGSAHRG